MYSLHIALLFDDNNLYAFSLQLVYDTTISYVIILDPHRFDDYAGMINKNEH